MDDAPDLPLLRVDILTIFPATVEAYCETSILGRARRAGLLELRALDLRDGAVGAHRSVDDAPYGGGAGMVLAPEPVFNVVERFAVRRPLFLLSPAGRRFDQALARTMAASVPAFSLLCGRYEGVDQRVVEHLVDDEISIGDFVLAGGELAALAVLEAVARLVPGVVGNGASLEEESFTNGLLEYPQYTRPAVFRGWDVPEVLLSGDHGAIARWRHTEAFRRTEERRPDLLDGHPRSPPAGNRSPREAEMQTDHVDGYPLKAARPDRAPRSASMAGDTASEE